MGKQISVDTIRHLVSDTTALFALTLPLSAALTVFLSYAALGLNILVPKPYSAEPEVRLAVVCIALFISLSTVLGAAYTLSGVAARKMMRKGVKGSVDMEEARLMTHYAQPRHAFFVAELNGVVLGCCAVFPRKDGEETEGEVGR
jgi:hypothetical protein